MAYCEGNVFTPGYFMIFLFLLSIVDDSPNIAVSELTLLLFKFRTQVLETKKYF